MHTTKSDPNNKPPRRLGRSPWLLALAVLLIVAVLVVISWLLLNQGGEGETRLIEGDGVRLTVPVEWNEEDISLNESCQSEELTCVAILSAPENYNFSLTWYMELAGTTVEEVDASEWKKFSEYYPQAILLSRDELEVGGLPAIQRTFLQNDQQNTPIYFRQVYILNYPFLYLITARFFSAEMMEAQAGVVDAVIESIEFTPMSR